MCLTPCSISARTIIAAPVIWFGSWLLLLMAFSGGLLSAASFSCVFGQIKRGPRGPLHTARIWMASAIPGGAPGYNDDKQFGNFITHLTVRTSQRLRGTYSRRAESQGKASLGAISA